MFDDQYWNFIFIDFNDCMKYKNDRVETKCSIAIQFQESIYKADESLKQINGK